MIAVAARANPGCGAGAAVHTRPMTRNVPVARVVRQGGIAVVPPPVPLRDRAAAAYDGLGDGAKGFVAAVVGLWPITAAVGAGIAMCWASSLG